MRGMMLRWPNGDRGILLERESGLTIVLGKHPDARMLPQEALRTATESGEVGVPEDIAELAGYLAAAHATFEVSRVLDVFTHLA